jgi:hypothetical protein
MWVEESRRRSTLFPTEKLTCFESPDWVITTASLGIEVSELLPEKQEGAAYSGPQVSTFQKGVVSKAEQFYRAHPDAPATDALVYFKNDWTRKRDAVAMGHALAQFVADNYPADHRTVTLDAVTRGVHGWVEGLSVVRILCRDGEWQAGRCSDVALLTYEQIAARIAAKNERIAVYRERLPGFRMWLLLATAFSVLHSLTVPDQISIWRFASDIDRVLLYSWERGVLEGANDGE